MTRRRPPVVSSTDANQDAIVVAFRSLGWSVQDLSNVGGGVPDLIVGGVLDGKRTTLLVEVKTATGRLNALQTRWHQLWRGQVCVVRTVDDVLALVGQGGERG